MASGSSIVEAAGSALLVWGVLLLFASPIVYRGWQNRVKYHEYASLHVESPSAATDGEVAMLFGRIMDISETIVSPVQSEKCKVTFWKVATYH